MEKNRYLPEGSLIGTKENREATASLSAIERAMENQTILEGTVTRCARDYTLTVSLGAFEGIIERNEIAQTASGETVRDIAAITRVGKAVSVRILSVEMRESGPLLHLSRRLAQEECAKNYLSKLIPGDIIPARVTHMEQFGAFVDIGCGAVSLLSIDCISVSRISHPRDRLVIGEFLRTVVRSIDRESGRIYVSHRELLGTWEENASCFEIGQTVPGIVRSVEDYGIFVELMPNLAGLAEYRDGISPGQTVSVYIKNIIPARMKLKLVIIDTCGMEPAQRRMNYFLADTADHIDRWQYSPSGANRTVESVFCEHTSRS